MSTKKVMCYDRVEVEADGGYDSKNRSFFCWKEIGHEGQHATGPIEEADLTWVPEGTEPRLVWVSASWERKKDESTTSLEMGSPGVGVKRSLSDTPRSV